MKSPGEICVLLQSCEAPERGWAAVAAEPLAKNFTGWGIVQQGGGKHRGASTVGRGEERGLKGGGAKKLVRLIPRYHEKTKLFLERCCLPHLAEAQAAPPAPPRSALRNQSFTDSSLSAG